MISEKELVPLIQLENVGYLATPPNLVLLGGPKIIISDGLDAPQRSLEDVD
jgi:hypothetical protein